MADGQTLLVSLERDYYLDYTTGDVPREIEEDVKLLFGEIEPFSCQLAQSYIQATAPSGDLFAVSFGMRLVSMGEAGWKEAALPVSQSVIRAMTPQLHEKYPDHTFVGKIIRT